MYRSVLARSTARSWQRPLLQVRSFCAVKKPVLHVHTDPLTKIIEGASITPKQQSKPKFDKRGRYEPQFYEVIEMFFDNVLQIPQSTNYGAINGYNCEREQGELLHWKESADEHGVTRIKLASDDYPRHLEIHWDHWLILICQHDGETKKKYDLKALTKKDTPQEYITKRREMAAAEKFILDNSLGTEEEKRVMKMPAIDDFAEDYTNSVHFGMDVPNEWMMALKVVKWPKSFTPPYLGDVDYFEVFRKSGLTDQFRKHAYFHGPPQIDTDASHMQNLATHLYRSDAKYSSLEKPLNQSHKNTLREENATYGHLFGEARNRRNK